MSNSVTDVRVGQVRRWMVATGVVEVVILNDGDLCRYRYLTGPQGERCCHVDYMRQHSTLALDEVPT